MRRLIRFPCEDAMLSGSIDEAAGSIGLLCVTGGSQVRTGPHRMLHQIAATVAAQGFPVFRYERRGLGDSDGTDPGYRDSGPDLIAAAAAFRAEAPGVRTIVGFGLCDGATTLALHGAAAGIGGIVLANPWLVETAPDDLAPAAARIHYRGRFLSAKAWGDVLRGRVNVFGAARSLFGSVTKADVDGLADDVAARLTPYAGRLTLILATGDGTAIAAGACWNADAFSHVRGETLVSVATDSHSFARSGDLDPVIAGTLNMLRNLDDAA